MGELVIQFLVIAGVVLYGFWNAQKLNKKKKQQNTTSEGGKSVRHYGENFPFPQASQQPVLVPAGDGQGADELEVEEGASAEMPLRRWKATVAMNGLNSSDYLATATIVAAEEDQEETVASSHSVGMENTEVVTDLRTMIVSSELLKPKYLEY